MLSTPRFLIAAELEGDDSPPQRLAVTVRNETAASPDFVVIVRGMLDDGTVDLDRQQTLKVEPGQVGTAYVLDDLKRFKSLDVDGRGHGSKPPRAFTQVVRVR